MFRIFFWQKPFHIILNHCINMVHLNHVVLLGYPVQQSYSILTFSGMLGIISAAGQVNLNA